MDNRSSYNVLVWDSKRPDRPTRSRQTQRAQIMDIPPIRQQPSNTSSNSSSSYSTPMEVPANASPQPVLAHELADFSTCEISDALVKLGLTHNAKENPVQRGGFIPDIRMMSPSPNDMAGQNTKICGFAYTVKMARADDPYSPKPAQHFVDAAPPGSIAVISAPPNIKSAVWGGLMTAGAQYRGVQGVVIDGRTRDLVEHRAAGFAVFARGGSTLGEYSQSPFTRPSALNVPITILPRPDFETCYENTFSAVEIHPGDLIVADIDGVVCVPPELIESVLDECRYSKVVDEKCMIDIQSGRSIQEANLPALEKEQEVIDEPSTPNGVSRRSTETTVTPRVAARNVLKSLLDLLPRTLPMESRRLWDQHASSAFDELESGKSRLIRIAIWGDEASGAGEVVTSLLDDPLSNNSNQRNMLHQRNSDSISRDGTYLNLKSNWLERLNAEIIECRGKSNFYIDRIVGLRCFASGLDPFPTLLSSDHVILVTDNIRLLDAPGLRNLLRTLSHAPSVHILVAERAPRAVYSLTQLDGTSPTVVKPDYAVQGLSAFGKGDINGYQKFLIESKIPQLAQQISRKCSELGAPSSPSSSTSVSVVRTATHIARATLAACEAAINDAQAALTSTAAPLSQFKTKISTVYPDAYQSALRGTVTVREGVAAAEQRVRAAFGRLPWYSLWWRADEVSGTLSEAISWGSLGTQLAFHAGRLSSIREQLYDQAVALATPSPVLTNKLAQIDARTPVGPDALSTPLMQRTAQLLAPGGPVEDVHRRAQAAVMTTAVSILGSGAIATGLFAIGSVGAGTTVGLGLLGSVLSIRWMQSAWARAEKRWWADWARVCAGLERDCEVALKEMVRERVTVSALAGIEGMETIVTRRAEIISALKKEAQGLEEQLVVLEQRLK